MKNLIDYFGAGNVYKNHREVIDFRITKLEWLTEKVIPLFDKYQIIGVKAKDFEDLKKIALLMKNKAHLTLEGLDQIRLIKSGMNRKR